MARANEELAEQVEGIIIDQRKVIAKVNAIGRQQEQVVFCFFLFLIVTAISQLPF